MAKISLRRFDVQAKWSVWVSAASVLPCVTMAWLLVRNWRGDIHQIVFANPMFQVTYLGCAAATMLLAVFGLVLGFNSAGQRRNELQHRSWLGFFVGSGAFTLGVILVLAFMLLKFQAD